jgi:uncharacterized protein
VRITYDRAKRDETLAQRKLDFEDAIEVFAGAMLTVPDLREDYGEPRYITYGLLRERMVVMVWTPRGSARRVFSMRKANAREQAHVRQQLSEAGRDDR